MRKVVFESSESRSFQVGLYDDLMDVPHEVGVPGITTAIQQPQPSETAGVGMLLAVVGHVVDSSVVDLVAEGGDALLYMYVFGMPFHPRGGNGTGTPLDDGI